MIGEVALLLVRCICLKPGNVNLNSKVCEKENLTLAQSNIMQSAKAFLLVLNSAKNKDEVDNFDGKWKSDCFHR